MRFAVFLVLAVLSGFVLTFAGSLGVAAPVPKHLMKEAENTDQAKLQGKWKLESIALGGMPLPNNAAGPNGGLEMILEFRGDKLTVTGPNDNVTATIKLDTVDGVKRCATVNTQKLDKDGKPAGKEEDVTFGYIIDGDKLTFAVRMDPGSGKSTTAADPSKPGTDTVLIVFTRVKEKN
jgi:uncharacterized protein (TIGR03067 family)